MAKHLTDKEKRKIIRDYVEAGNYTAVAAKYGVSRNTVKNAVLGDPKFMQKCKERKNKNTLAVLAHMDAQRSTICQITDRYLMELLDVEQFEKLTPIQLASALTMLLDKFAPAPQRGAIDTAGGLIEAGPDPLSISLKETAQAILDTGVFESGGDTRS